MEQVKKENINKWIDKGLLFFFLIFIASLTNSIFANQIGYFGVFLLLIVKSIFNRENAFEKTGLEIPLILFMVVEVISTVLSVNQYGSFHNMLKRILILPILYIMVAYLKDIEAIKKTIILFLVCGILTMLVYIYFSLDYFIYGLFSKNETGPVIFEHTITTSELFAFPFIMLFAFLLNKKGNLKERILIYLGVAISAVALFATYKRTGWLGAGAAILIMMIVNRNWVSSAILIMLILASVFFQKNVSFFEVYRYNDKGITPHLHQKTNGRAAGFLLEDSICYLADYENGVVKYSNNSVIQKIETPMAVNKLLKVNDSLMAAYMIDTRIMLINRQKNSGLNTNKVFTTAGLTTSLCSDRSKLFILDKDSGLTIIESKNSFLKTYRIPQLTGYNKCFADSNWLILFSGEQEQVDIFNLSPAFGIKKMFAFKMPPNVYNIFYFNDQIICSDEKRLFVVRIIDTGNVTVSKTSEISRLNLLEKSGDKYFGVTAKNELLIFNLTENHARISSKLQLSYQPTDIKVTEDKIYISYYKYNRILSVFDKYNLSNITRLSMWGAGLRIFLDNPFFGIGDIGTEKHQLAYRNYYDKEFFGHMHNIYIHILVTLGGFGFIAAMFLFWRVIHFSLELIAVSKGEPFINSLALGGFGCIVSFFISGLTEWNFGDHEVVSILWFIVGLILVTLRVLKTQNIKIK